MDYKDKIRRAETLGRKLLEYGEKMCSPDLCTCANVMLEDATTITYLLSRAEEAEAIKEALVMSNRLLSPRMTTAEARCALLDEARENANEACAKWEGMYRMALERAEKAEKLISWIYSETCVSVENDMSRHLDWLKDKIDEWRGCKEDV